MHYPFWDSSISYGLLMGCIAVLHVFISHFAIGGGLYLVWQETLARKSGDQQGLDFLERLSKFFVLLTLVMGVLSCLGFWFIIGLFSPAATEVLIHNFVWFWATEWTFFIIEITAAIIYFYGWKTLSAKNHIIVGWIYFASAWMSLFVINGIITFMLTPGDWLTTGNIWDAFFNPTFWPSLVFRTGMSVMLAGFYALLIASRYPAHDFDGFKERLVRKNALWGLTGLILLVPSFVWYWKAIPTEITTNALAMMKIPITSMHQGYWYAGAAALLLIVFGLILPRRCSTVVAVALMICGLMLFAKFEWFRESIRKPYAIGGYMFANAVEVAHTPTYQSEGYLKHMTFRTGDDGADLFRRACQSCHTMEGSRALKPVFDGTDKEFIAAIIKGVEALKGNMPPFYGTEEEARLLANYIYDKIDKRPLSEIYGLHGAPLGKKVFEVRCGKCHEMGGYNDKTASLIAIGETGYEEFIDTADDYGEAMPAFTGDEAEKEALIEFLKTLGHHP